MRLNGCSYHLAGMDTVRASAFEQVSLPLARDKKITGALTKTLLFAMFPRSGQEHGGPNWSRIGGRSAPALTGSGLPNRPDLGGDAPKSSAQQKQQPNKTTNSPTPCSSTAYDPNSPTSPTSPTTQQPTQQPNAAPTSQQPISPAAQQTSPKP